MPTLRELLLRHDNDYRIDALAALTPHERRLPSLSVIIPYFDSPDTLPHVLSHLTHAVAFAKQQDPSWCHEVIIVDDGSRHSPQSAAAHTASGLTWRLVSHGANRGRAMTRNTGLRNARHDVCLFIDADIIVDQHLICNILTLYSQCQRRAGTTPIIPAMFSHRAIPPSSNSPLLPSSLVLNDFRIGCTYQDTWIGCEDDRRFVGQTFHLLTDTHMFRTWQGKIAAWWLPNMVLGGCFAVDRVAAMRVRGFDERFVEYGFTETSLPTKLLALEQHKVVPLRSGGAIHTTPTTDPLARQAKDACFRRAHAVFNDVFLNSTGDMLLH